MRQSFVVIAVASLLVAGAMAQSPSAQPSSNQDQAVPPYQPPTPTVEQDIHQNLKDVHFAFDRSELTPEDRQELQAAASWLKANPNVYVTIAGDADERGSIVYNVYLSDERAKAAKDALVAMGVPESQIVFATGWGKLYPTCNQADESCWSQNRRAHFEPWQAGSLAAHNSAPARAEAEQASVTDQNVRSQTVDGSGAR